MSMSTHIIGIKPPDEKWKKMKDVYDACEKAGVSAPDEVLDFFENDVPDDSGVTIELGNDVTIREAAVSEWSEDTMSGFEVDLSRLPSDIKILRFYNSF